MRDAVLVEWRTGPAPPASTAVAWPFRAVSTVMPPRAIFNTEPTHDQEAALTGMGFDTREFVLAWATRESHNTRSPSSQFNELRPHTL